VNIKPQMRTPNQARIRLHQKRIELGLTMTALAAKIRRPRSSVSRAVNHGKHPRLLQQVKEALGV